MKYTNGYPETVEEYANKLIQNCNNDSLLEEAGIKNRKTFFESVCEISCDKFIKGDGVVLNENEYLEAISITMVKESVNSLEEEGLVINVSDDDEEPYYVLTEKGKKHAENIENTEL